jgi:hydrogenase/urease accessory protein HupE
LKVQLVGNVIRSLVAAFGLLLVPFASAHDLDLTLIKVTDTGSNKVIAVTTPLSRLVQTAGLGERPSGPSLDMCIRERLGIDSITAATIDVNSQADMVTWTAKLNGNAEVPNRRFDSSTTSARTIIASYEGNQLTTEAVIDPEDPKPTMIGMLGTGIHHILSGLDHILFVIGLALLGGTWKTILKVLSSFTVAHTMTLAAASLGWVRGNPRIIEPLIALSIVALAIEGLRRFHQKSPSGNLPRVAIAFGFGLIHGFGFAGGLTLLGLQGHQLMQNFLAFSVGIELGQILILAPTLLLIALALRFGQDRARYLSLCTSVFLGMIGCFWFVERVL